MTTWLVVGEADITRTSEEANDRPVWLARCQHKTMPFMGYHRNSQHCPSALFTTGFVTWQKKPRSARRPSRLPLREKTLSCLKELQRSPQKRRGIRDLPDSSWILEELDHGGKREQSTF